MIQLAGRTATVVLAVSVVAAGRIATGVLAVSVLIVK
jgi:hypothetical protein